MVCGGSLIGCVLIECKDQHSGKWEQQQHRTSSNQLCIQQKCTAMREMNGKCWHLPVSTLHGYPLYEVHQIKKAATGLY